MKKVLIVATVPSMIGQFNMSNIKILRKAGYQVDVACNMLERTIWNCERVNQFKQDLEEMEISIHHIDFSRNPYALTKHWKAYLQLHRLLDKCNYEYLHSHTPIAGALSRIAGHRTGTRVIYTAHGFHFYRGAPYINWLIYYPIEWLLSLWTEVLICITKEDYVRAQQFWAKKVVYIPGVGIDLEKIESVQINRLDKRKELSIPDETILLLSVGELNQNKNHQAVIRALAQINNNKIHYLIAGQGALQQYLETLSKELHVEKQVHLLGYRKDIWELCKASDIFVFPSRREGLSVSLMEALACGMPCIVSDIRGNKDLVQNRVNGVCLPVNKFEHYLVSELKHISLFPEELKTYKNEGRQEIKKSSRQNIDRQMRNIYSLMEENQ